MIHIPNYEILIIIDFDILVLTWDTICGLKLDLNHDLLMWTSPNTFSLMNMVVTEITSLQKPHFQRQHFSSVYQTLFLVKHTHVNNILEQLFLADSAKFKFK